MAAKKSKNEQLQEKIFHKRKNLWSIYSKKEHSKIMSFAEGYKKYMASNKTERLSAEYVVSALKKNGYKDISTVKKAKTGDKLFKNIKGKAILATIVGKKPESLRLIGSHMDSPRLDLKPFPLFEDSELALFQSHYYGGIKKYHWVNTPLAIHGVVFTKKGKKVTISIGDKPSDPVFVIPDLLIHLAKNQAERKAMDVVKGEELNVVVGSIPVNDEKITSKIKFAVLNHLYDKYGIIEEDFTVAELELVPAMQPVDVGFDRSLVGAYGHDDKVCVYASLQALLATKNPTSTAIALFADKEEIGSFGNTGAASLMLQIFAEELSKVVNLKVSPSKFLENAKAISADVTAGINPNYKDVQDPQNTSYIGGGIHIGKYGGGGGKSGTADAHAEYMVYLRSIADKKKIHWQTGEMGLLDIGGGGTIGVYLARYGLDVVDAGPAVLAMHSTCELVSKADIYNSYEFYKAFFESF